MLIKSEENTSSMTTPRWVFYDSTDDTFTKIIPFFYTPGNVLEDQAKLINDFCGFDLILEYKIITLEEPWTTDTNEFRNPNEYLEYKMSRAPGEPLQDSRIFDYLNDIIFPYIETAAILYPYGNVDATTGNIFYTDDNYVLIDWDTVLLGHKLTPQYFYESIRDEVVNKYVDSYGRRVNGDTFDEWYRAVVRGSILDLDV